MAAHDTAFDQELERRLAVIASDEFDGEPLETRDYAALFAVTVALPIVLLLVGWSL